MAADLPTRDLPDPDELTVPVRTIAWIVAVLVAAFAGLYWLLTSPILPTPDDQPAQSPAATAGQIPPGGPVQLTPAPLRPGGMRVTRTLLVSTRTAP